MVNLLAHFEGSELVDFINFVNLLVHKLQVRPPVFLLARGFVISYTLGLMIARIVRCLGRTLWPIECPRYEPHVSARHRNRRYTHT
jgi:hypothetical protein